MALCIYPAILLGASLLGQTTASPPSFEAASLKLSAPGGKYSFSADPGRLEVRNVSLKILILMAYPGNSYSSAGPGWLDSVIFDLVAKLPASAASQSHVDRGRMVQVMMQGLLAERFKLKVHQEVKDLPGYALVIAPGGPKMRRVESDHNVGSVRLESITGSSTSIETLVSSLRADLAAPVQNMTGLSGFYEFTLTWTPSQIGQPIADDAATPPADQGPSIFTAVQEQLGLKLESRKVPTNMVYVDHVERAPVDN